MRGSFNINVIRQCLQLICSLALFSDGNTNATPLKLLLGFPERRTSCPTMCNILAAFVFQSTPTRYFSSVQHKKWRQRVRESCYMSKAAKNKMRYHIAFHCCVFRLHHCRTYAKVKPRGIDCSYFSSLWVSRVSCVKQMTSMQGELG